MKRYVLRPGNQGEGTDYVVEPVTCGKRRPCIAEINITTTIWDTKGNIVAEYHEQRKEVWPYPGAS